MRRQQVVAVERDPDAGYLRRPVGIERDEMRQRARTDELFGAVGKRAD
jgi:hypothetical protein